MPPVQRLLGSGVATIFGLESLAQRQPLVDFPSCWDGISGVYLWILKPPRRTMYLDDSCYVHVGSPRTFWTLNEEVYLLNRGPRVRKSHFPEDEIRSLRLGLPGIFIPLFEVPFEPNPEDAARVEALVKLAEAILTIWLGAVNAESRSIIDPLVPFGGHNVRYNSFSDQRMLLQESSNMQEIAT
ncbi:MAG: hypothetical protein Q9170_001969 [Blastenia crenularia]